MEKPSRFLANSYCAVLFHQHESTPGLPLPTEREPVGNSRRKDDVKYVVRWMCAGRRRGGSGVSRGKVRFIGPAAPAMFRWPFRD